MCRGPRDGLHQKGGKEHETPRHHDLDDDLAEYIAAAGIADDRKGPLFRTTRGRAQRADGNLLLQSDVWRMIRRRALAAGNRTEIGCHTFREAGISTYLNNGDRLEIAQQMAIHEVFKDDRALRCHLCSPLCQERY